jgi:hypothetical protein
LALSSRRLLVILDISLNAFAVLFAAWIPEQSPRHSVLLFHCIFSQASLQASSKKQIYGRSALLHLPRPGFTPVWHLRYLLATLQETG